MTAIPANTGAFHDRHITAYPGTLSNMHILMNHRKRVHLYIGIEPGIRMNGCIGMDHSAVQLIGFQFFPPLFSLPYGLRFVSREY